MPPSLPRTLCLEITEYQIFLLEANALVPPLYTNKQDTSAETLSERHVLKITFPPIPPTLFVSV